MSHRTCVGQTTHSPPIPAFKALTPVFPAPAWRWPVGNTQTLQHRAVWKRFLNAWKCCARGSWGLGSSNILALDPQRQNAASNWAFLVTCPFTPDQGWLWADTCSIAFRLWVLALHMDDGKFRAVDTLTNGHSGSMKKVLYIKPWDFPYLMKEDVTFQQISLF